MHYSATMKDTSSDKHDLTEFISNMGGAGEYLFNIKKVRGSTYLLTKKYWGSTYLGEYKFNTPVPTESCSQQRTPVYKAQGIILENDTKIQCHSLFILAS